MAWHYIGGENDVELWQLPQPSGADVFEVRDTSRTPEKWTFGSPTDAIAKFEARLKEAKADLIHR